MISWCGKPLTSRLRMAVRPPILVKLGMAVLLGLHGLTTLLYVGLSETQGQSSFFPFSGHLMGIPDFSAASLFFAHQVAWVYHVLHALYPHCSWWNPHCAFPVGRLPRASQGLAAEVYPRDSQRPGEIQISWRRWVKVIGYTPRIELKKSCSYMFILGLDLYKSVVPQVFNFESHDLASFKWFGDFDWLIPSQVLAS
jgi:hypothetical protein